MIAPLMSRGTRQCIAVVLAIVAAAAMLAAAASPASAAGAPRWTITSVTTPTSFAPGGEEESYVITATNTGDAPAEGASSPITVVDKLPEGISLGPGEVSGIDRRTEAGLTCQALTITCGYEGSVLPGDSLVITVSVK